MDKFTASIPSMASVVVNEYKLVNDKVARVIITCSSSMSKDAMYDKLAEHYEGSAMPVRGSFRWLNEGTNAIGYLTLARATKVITTRKQLASYREVSSNMFLDEGDKSLWELKESGGGKYLCRQGHDNLAELIEAGRVTARGSTPRMRSVMMESAKAHEFIAYIDTAGFSSETDYGFCAGVDAKTGEYLVVSMTTKQPVSVKPECVVSAHYLAGKQFSVTSKAKLVKADAYDKTAVINYYRQLYAYAPDYLKLVIEEINQQAAM